MRGLRTRRDERGAAAVVVAISLVAVFAAAMLTIDAGMLWTQRRTIATATDSAALAEARRVAMTSGATTTCGSTWRSMLARNTGAIADPVSCTIVRGTRSGQGSVEIEARLRSPVGFGRALGVRDASAFSASVARFDPVSMLRANVRPIGICTQGAHMAEWFAYLNGALSPADYALLRGAGSMHPVYPGAGVVHRVMYTKDQPLSCGGAPGNWGFVDFNGGSNSTGETRKWIRDGYDENAIAVGDCNADNAVPTEWCPGNPGAFSHSISNALSGIIGQTFPLPLFDEIRGNGNNARLRVVGFLGVTLRGFQVTGAQAGRYLDLEFTSLMGNGTCCSPSGTAVVDGGVRVVRLCSVDHDPLSVATRCR